MAAVLCKGIGDICRVVCNAIEFVCCLPCKACGTACHGCSDLFGTLCSGPFSAFVAVALASQIPPIAVGLIGIGDLAECRGSLWLLGAVLYGVVHISAALYLAIRTGNADDESLAHLRTAYKRASHLLCNDPWIALYIVLLLGYVAFLIFGVTLAFDAGECPESVARNAEIALFCGWFYLLGGSAALAVGMCCACCDKRDYAPSPPPPTPGSAQQNFYPGAGNPNFNPHYKPPGGSSKPGQQRQQQQQQQQQHFSEEQEIPMAYAEAIPEPTAPPPSFSYDSSNEPPPAATAPGKSSATAQTPEGEARNDKGSGNLGATVGKGVGKLFNVNESNQRDFEKMGQQAGEVVGKHLSTAKSFVQSQLDKKKKGKATVY